MENKEKTPEKKRSVFVGFLAVLVLLFGGYFGNSIIDDTSEEEYKKDQEIEKNVQENINDNNKEEQKEDNQESSLSNDTITITYHFRSEKLWQQHYEKHGIEMGFDNKEDYLLAANKVMENENVLHKLEEEDGDDVYYLEETNEFVIVSTDGYLRTYFHPNDGINYFNRQ